jgi:hypothetical protein
MVERLRKDIDWNAPNYVVQASHILKLMLLDYVRDYLARGDIALIEYSDKENIVRLANEQRALQNTPSYINDVLNKPSQDGTPGAILAKIEDAIIWSKIKFGLKPVIAINHITIYQNQNGIGPHILIESKQIYANHYFNASLALTAFVNVPGANPESYLIYENRSRADGLGGPFGRITRGIVAEKAVSGLTAVLEQSKATLNARTFSRTESIAPMDRSRTWRQWKVASVRLFFTLLLITAFAGLLALSNYRWKTEVS